MDSTDDYLGNIANVITSEMEGVKETTITPEELAQLRMDIPIMHDSLISAILADYNDNALVAEAKCILRMIHKLYAITGKALEGIRLEQHIYWRLVDAVADKEAEKNAEIAKLKELLAQK